MLATLNLQLPAMELTDDSLSTPVVTPDSGLSAEGGFADVLRVRVDAAQDTEILGGVFLPQAGSELPLLEDALELTDEETPLPAIPQLLVEDSELRLADQIPEIAIDVPVDYPSMAETATDAKAVESHQPALPLAPATVIRQPASEAVDLVADEGGRVVTPEAKPLASVAGTVARPEITARVQDVMAAAGERIGVAPQAIGQREVRLPGLASQVAQAAVVDGNENVTLVDAPRRPDASGLQAPALVSEEISDVFKARPTVIQPVQVLNTQPNPQQAQVLFSTSPAVTTAGDTSYAAAAQQATDLLPTPVRDAAWGEQISERVLMMAGNQLKTAEIRLTPAELGPLRVQVSVDDGAANVTFHAQHAVTREALEQALPRLRELLAENGLSLGQASVGEQGVAERNRDEQTNNGVPGATSDESADAGPENEQAAPRLALGSNGLVDTFA